MNTKKCGCWMQGLRETRCMTRSELASRLGVSEETVAQWEGGLTCPTLGQIRQLSVLLGYTVTELVNGEAYHPHRSAAYTSDAPNPLTPPEEYHRDVTVTLERRSDQAISPLLFGDNLEHTRGCICGGISAELLKNRKFAGMPSRFGCSYGWYPIGEDAFFAVNGAAFSPDGFMAYTKHHEDHRMPRRHECLSQLITNFHPGHSGIGQDELYLRENTDYEFFLAATSVGELSVTVSLLGADRTVYDRREILIYSDGYREYELTLHAPCTDSAGRLEITFDTEGTLVLGAVSLLPVGHFRGMRRDVIDRMKELGITILRWPGGNFAGDYNWKDGLLPRHMRAPLQSALGLHTQPHTGGYDFHEINTDDFIALCREIGAEPYITINPAWGTPEESAQWVEYCNGDETTPYGKLRIERGYPEPYHVRFWGLGNEAGHGHMEGPNIPSHYATVVRRHAEQMLAVSPALTFLSSGAYPDEAWVNDGAIPLSDISSLISVHHYVMFPNFSDPTKRKEAYHHIVGSIENEFLLYIRVTRMQLGESPVQISFDEWNAYHAWYRQGSVSEGIMAASMLNLLCRCADPLGVVMACHFEAVNEGATRIYPDRAELSPVGQAISLMKDHAGGMVCALEEDVVATEKDRIVTCTLLNRSYDREKRFTLQNCGKLLSAVLYTSDDVIPHTAFSIRELPVTMQGGCADVVLPPHSIALLKAEPFADGV